MTSQIENWARAQTKSIFGGIKKPKRGKTRFALLLTLPFFFVPILIAGYLIADVGDALSKKAVAFLHSKEKRPATVVEPRRLVASTSPKKRTLVASKTN